MPTHADQSTLKAPFERHGRGLHTGREATVRALPAPAGSGYVFKRTDLPGQPCVKAELARVTATERGTVVQDGEASAATIEHLLGAVYGLGVDNVLFEINGPEVPILDGSGRDWAEAVQAAGIQRQDAPRDFYHAQAFDHAQGAKRMQVAPSDGFEVCYRVDYQHPALGRQELSLKLEPEAFVRDVAPARTFCFEHEVEALRKAGLIKGGSLDCALVLGDHGVLNPPVRFEDEFVRHKLLDFLGDLALSGRRFRGAFTLDRAGHGFHVEAVKALLNAQDGRPQGRKTMSSNAPLLDVMDIQALLPHRFPFLLLDKVTALELKQKATGWKNVTMNEWFFQGHFPGHPIYPGVLIIEGLAQCGGILIMKSYIETQGKLTYFMSIDNCRFRRPVRPGDVLRYELEILKVKGPVSRLKGVAYVDDEVAAEAELMCMSVAPDQG